MSGRKEPNQTRPEPKGRRKKNQEDRFRINGADTFFTRRPPLWGCSNSPPPSLERKRSSTTCICCDSAEVPVKIMAVPAYSKVLTLSDETKPLAAVKLKKTNGVCAMHQVPGPKYKSLSAIRAENFRKTFNMNPLEMEINKKRKKKLKISLPACRNSSSSEELVRRRGESDSTLKKKNQLSRNVDYIANQRIINSFGSQYPSDEGYLERLAKNTEDAEVFGQQIVLYNRSRSPSPNLSKPGGDEKQHADDGKPLNGREDFCCCRGCSATSSEERPTRAKFKEGKNKPKPGDLEIVGQRQKFPGNSLRKLEEHSNYDGSDYSDGRSDKFNNKNPLHKPLKGKNLCRCRSCSPGRMEEHSDSATMDRYPKFQNVERLVKAKEPRAAPKTITNEPNRQNRREPSKLEPKEVKKNDPNHFKYQFEEILDSDSDIQIGIEIVEHGSLGKDENESRFKVNKIRTDPRYKTNECPGCGGNIYSRGNTSYVIRVDRPDENEGNLKAKNSGGIPKNNKTNAAGSCGCGSSRSPTAMEEHGAKKDRQAKTKSQKGIGDKTSESKRSDHSRSRSSSPKSMEELSDTRKHGESKGREATNRFRTDVGSTPSSKTNDSEMATCGCRQSRSRSSSPKSSEEPSTDQRKNERRPNDTSLKVKQIAPTPRNKINDHALATSGSEKSVEGRSRSTSPKPQATGRQANNNDTATCGCEKIGQNRSRSSPPKTSTARRDEKNESRHNDVRFPNDSSLKVKQMGITPRNNTNDRPGTSGSDRSTDSRSRGNSPKPQPIFKAHGESQGQNDVGSTPSNKTFESDHATCGCGRSRSSSPKSFGEPDASLKVKHIQPIPKDRTKYSEPGVSAYKKGIETKSSSPKPQEPTANRAQNKGPQHDDTFQNKPNLPRNQSSRSSSPTAQTYNGEKGRKLDEKLKAKQFVTAPRTETSECPPCGRLRSVESRTRSSSPKPQPARGQDNVRKLDDKSRNDANLKMTQTQRDETSECPPCPRRGDSESPNRSSLPKPQATQTHSEDYGRKPNEKFRHEAKQVGTVPRNETSECPPCGRLRNIHSPSRSNSPKPQAIFQARGQDNSRKSDDKSQNDANLKMKQLGTTPRNETSECPPCPYRGMGESPYRSSSPKPHPTQTHDYGRKPAEKFRHEAKQVGTVPRNETSECPPCGRLRNVKSPSRSNSPKPQSTFQARGEAKGRRPDDKFQNEAIMKGKHIGTVARNETSECPPCGRRRFPESPNRSGSPKLQAHSENRVQKLDDKFKNEPTQNLKHIGTDPSHETTECPPCGRRRTISTRDRSTSPKPSQEHSAVRQRDHGFQKETNLNKDKPYKSKPIETTTKNKTNECKPCGRTRSRSRSNSPKSSDEHSRTRDKGRNRDKPKNENFKGKQSRSTWKDEERTRPTDFNQKTHGKEDRILKERGQKQSDSLKNFHNWDKVAPGSASSFECPKKSAKEDHQRNIINTYFGSDHNCCCVGQQKQSARAGHGGNEQIPSKSDQIRNKRKYPDPEPPSRGQNHDRPVTPTKNRMGCEKCNRKFEETRTGTPSNGIVGKINIEDNVQFNSSIPAEGNSPSGNFEIEFRFEATHLPINEDTLIGIYSKVSYQNLESLSPTTPSTPCSPTTPSSPRTPPPPPPANPPPPATRPLRYCRDHNEPKRPQTIENCTCSPACLDAFPKQYHSNIQKYEMLSSSGNRSEESEENYPCTCTYAGACFKRDSQNQIREVKFAKDKPFSGDYLKENKMNQNVACYFMEARPGGDFQNHKEEKQDQMETIFMHPSYDNLNQNQESERYIGYGDGLEESWKSLEDRNLEGISLGMVSKDGNYSETPSTPPSQRKRNLGLKPLRPSPIEDSFGIDYYDGLVKLQKSSNPHTEFVYMATVPEMNSSIISGLGMETADANVLQMKTKAEPPRSSFKSSSLQRGPQEVKYGLLLPPNRSPLKILLVFIQTDPVSDAMSRAADKLGFDVTFCSSYDGALEEFLSKLHDLVIIDTRTSAKSLDFDTLCRSIRNTKGSQHTAVVAIVKKSAFDKDDVTVLSLLDAGYNRCIVETSNIVHCVNELIQLKHSDMRPMAQAATSQALYAALDKCRDIVLITDDSYRLQYANRASERNLGYRHDETLGKTLQEQLIHDPVQMNTMSSSLMRAREWQGQISLRRKGQESVVSICKAVPITCAGRAPTHFVMVMDISGTIEPIAVTPDKPRGSVHSIRRPSTDVRSVGSDYLRRTSLAKLSALPLEAPITKIITLLAQAQEQSAPQVVTIIDKAVEILHSTELYSPHVKDDLKLRSDEPVTSDLISALLTQPHQPSISISSRRSSNDSSSVIRSANRPVSKVKVPAQIKDLLDTALTWEFDIFRLEDLTNKRPLVHLGMSLFTHFDVSTTLNCDERTLVNWLTVIEVNYHADNAYHNSTHAADVMQATAGFLEKDRLKSIMEPLDEATSLLAACAHDIDHPGKSSAFLSNCDNPLAILYNDVTVLENHHAALTFKLTLGDDRVNIFKHLDRETYKVARHNVIDMILATEMTKHFEHLAKFVNVFCAKTSRTDLETEEYIPITLPENITLVKRMMIKCADVSNPTRPLRLCVEWARRIAEEYFTQTDEEKSKGLPVVMPMFDRTTCSIPKSQIGFVDYIVHDMFEAWDAFIDMPELVTYMRQNYIRWKEFDEQGHTTTADIRKLQNTVLMVPLFPSKNPAKRSE